jgi:acyl-CoA thioester hydrolase
MLPEQPTFPVRVKRAVLWGDMDAIGHVNNTIYLRWFEEARIQYLRREELLPKEGPTPGIILASQRCDYLAPVRYPDTIEVRVSIIKLGNTSMTMCFEISSEALGKNIARGDGVIVWFDYATERSMRIPDETRERVITFERAGYRASG